MASVAITRDDLDSEGVRDVPRSGRPPALSAEQMQELEELVLAGPDLAEDGVVRRRCLTCGRRSRPGSRWRCMSEPWARCCAGFG